MAMFKRREMFARNRRYSFSKFPPLFRPISISPRDQSNDKLNDFGEGGGKFEGKGQIWRIDKMYNVSPNSIIFPLFCNIRPSTMTE